MTAKRRPQSLAERSCIGVAALLCLLTIAARLEAKPASPAEPIIDMHVHAMISNREHPARTCPNNQPVTYDPVDPVSADVNSITESCPRPIFSETDRAQFEKHSVRALRDAGVRRAVLIGSDEVLDRWQRMAPGLFIPADGPGGITTEELQGLRSRERSGGIQVFAEVSFQYFGISADDPRADAFWSLAEERDVPVGIHLGMGMPVVGDYARSDPYRVALTSPFQLESVLKKHPRLRVYAMHAASPLTEEMIAMLFTYPNLYVDVAANDWNMPRAQFYSELKRMVDAGFSKRIMFGSDQTIFPQAIGIAVRTIAAAPFLTAQQKRDIFYNNAARFLRLTPEQIASDHRP
jgi:hypothetical protein